MLTLIQEDLLVQQANNIFPPFVVSVIYFLFAEVVYKSVSMEEDKGDRGGKEACNLVVLLPQAGKNLSHLLLQKQI